jgi:hypothetical protein
MKCAAARTEVDAEDIRFLAKMLGLRSSEEVLSVVLQYVAEVGLPVRFIDEFRLASAERRAALAADGPSSCGQFEGLVAAVVSSLCRETGTEAPSWLRDVASPDPFFAFPGRSFALRLRLMLESPPAFRARSVFVPANYLSRT